MPLPSVDGLTLVTYDPQRFAALAAGKRDPVRMLTREQMCSGLLG